MKGSGRLLAQRYALLWPLEKYQKLVPKNAKVENFGSFVYQPQVDFKWTQNNQKVSAIALIISTTKINLICESMPSVTLYLEHPESALLPQL